MGKSGSISFWTREIAGSFGDLPLFFIFLVGLSQFSDLNPLSILFWSGIAHILSGLIFKVPLSLQPMKAMGLYAIAHGVSQGELLTAGIGTAVLILVMNFFGLFQKLYDIFPTPVVRGIQLGLAFTLLKKAYELVSSHQPYFHIYGIFLIFAAPLIFLFLKKQHFFIFGVLGVGVAILLGRGVLPFPSLHLSGDFFEIHLASLKWTEAVLTMILIQFPLTIANSIFSPALLIKDYFPEKKLKASQIATSVGLINLFTCPWGGMPACHGAGGIAAQYQFGARTGFSIIFLGSLKVSGALALGGFVFQLAQFFPKILLGILFVFPAFDLCYRALRVDGIFNLFVMLFTCLSYVLWHAGSAMIIGCVVFYIFSQTFIKEKLGESLNRQF